MKPKVKYRHTHGNHIPKVLRKKISWLESLSVCTKLVIGKTHNIRHNGTPGKLEIQRETHTGSLKVKGYTNDGIIDLFVFGDKIKLTEMI
jgi:hypothetical protein